MLCISSLEKRILYLSYAYFGSCHDYGILKTEFNPQNGNWFDNHITFVDLGFLGIQKDYCKKIRIPYKNTKLKKLTEDQKLVNTHQSQLRVFVEHAIGGMKRYRILSDKLRMKNILRYNQITGVCAGLWNFQLNH